MITDEQDAKLRDLWNWVLDYKPSGKSRKEFWDELDERAGDLRHEAWADGADEGLRERYTDVLDLAADRGFAGPDESAGEIMA